MNFALFLFVVLFFFPIPLLERTLMTMSVWLLQVVLACLLVAVAARPGEILSYDAEDHKHEQNGEAGTAVSGSYSYKDVDGKEYTVEYVADENGYRATGAHLPVAPEVPAAPEAAEPAAEPADRKSVG